MPEVMPATALFSGVPVAELAPAFAWYEQLMGRPPDFYPHDREAVWQLARTGWIYVVEDPARAGRALVTVLVEDLDAHVAGIADRGLATEPIETLPGKVRRAAIEDPEGNRITFGEPLSQEG
jgi:predicted enzyme related to lactoylglutathione lyase